jgi:hypothetical protein
LFSCGSKKEKGNLLSQDKMKAVMWDIFQAQAFTENFIKNDSSKNVLAESAKLQQQVFALHKITKQDYDRTYSYYKVHPDEMKVLLDSISAFAENQRRDMMMNRYNKPERPHK